MAYQFLKRVLKRVLPSQMLLRHELFFRSIYALPYYGDQHECNICTSKLKRFILLNRGDLLCPVCGSLPRHRRLWHYLSNNMTLEGTLLHFSPSRPLWRKLRAIKTLEYITTDYEQSPIVQYHYDITDIEIKDATVNNIICYHVLEHIPEDHKAIKELYRILKPGGQLLVQTPFKEGMIYENERIKTPEERLEHFGQEDHVRIYSVKGLAERLERPGFDVEIIKFSEAGENTLGLKEQEYLLLCRKA